MTQVLDIKAEEMRAAAMREAAHIRAAAFTWEQVSDILLEKVKFVAQMIGAMSRPNGHDATQIREILIYTTVHQPRPFFHHTERSGKTLRP